jgi:hypothetical protein
MNPQELLEFMQHFFGRNIEIMKVKSADYSAQSTDALGNFKAIDNMAGFPESVPIGFITRMMDKMMRITSFVKNGTLLVSDESVEDTLSDLANYAGLFAAWLASQKVQEKQGVAHASSIKS